MAGFSRYRIPQKREQEPPRIMTINEAAVYYRTSYRTIKRAVDEGRIPCARLGEQTYRIARDTLDRFICNGGKVEDGKEVNYGKESR